LARSTILVNNAGIAPRAPIEEFTMKDFERAHRHQHSRSFRSDTGSDATHAQKADASFTLAAATVPTFPTLGGRFTPSPKVQSRAFTKGPGRDLGPRGITVNNVQPGPVDTDLNPANGKFANATRQHVALGVTPTRKRSGQLSSLISPAGSQFHYRCQSARGRRLQRNEVNLSLPECLRRVITWINHDAFGDQITFVKKPSF